MPPIELDTIPQVATDFQNRDHRVEAELLNACVEALDAGSPELAQRLERLATHTREHFAREDEAMRRTGFPPFHVHHEEHERVLLELSTTVAHHQANGDLAGLRRYLAEDVVRWFVTHIETKDAITARWIASHGGTPVG